MIIFCIFLIYTGVDAVMCERLPLKIFENYHLTSLTYYHIPPDVQSAVFYLLPHTNKPNCPVKNIDIYMQYRKFPLIYSSINKSDYVLQNSHRFRIRMRTSHYYDSYPFFILYPLPGVWFITAHIPKEVLKIKQEGLSSDCIYFLNISHVWNKFNVLELKPNTMYENALSNQTLHIYKFYISKITWSFKVMITLLNNHTEIEGDGIYNLNIVLSEHLLSPITLNNETLDVIRTNCTLKRVASPASYDSTCIITEKYPRIDTYYYIMVKYDENNLSSNGSLPYEIVYRVETCDNQNNIFDKTELSQPLQDMQIFDEGHDLTKNKSINHDGNVIKANNYSAWDNLTNNGSRNRYVSNSSLNEKTNGEDPSGVCPAIIVSLERSHLKQHLTDSFVLKYGFLELNTLSIDSEEPLLVTFSLEDYIDNGGTLVVVLTTGLSVPKELVLQTVLVLGCLSYHRIPRLDLVIDGNDTIAASCHPTRHAFPLAALAHDPGGRIIPGINFNLSNRSKEHIADYDRLIVPYPTTGRWFLYLRPYCFITTIAESNSTNSSGRETMEPMACPDGLTFVTFNIRTEPCIMTYTGSAPNKNGDGEHEEDKTSSMESSSRPSLNPNMCGGKMRGRCHISTQRKVLITGCQCLAGWQGIACDDGKKAISKSRQIFYVTLLTTSNLMFLPVILFSFSIGLYSESAIYFLNMVSSTFYHACDEAVFKYCMFSYESLQYLDFYTSVLSMVVTMNTLSALTNKLHSLLNVVSAVIVSLLVQANRLDLWTFLGPLLCSGCILLISWVWRSYITRSLYPSRQALLKRFLPGIVLAFGGLLIYLYAQTEDNYPYIHSMWHIIMSASILILLSEKKLDIKISQSLFDLPIDDNTEEPLRTPAVQI